MEDLRIMKNDELRDIARSYVITGAWKMNKNQLIDSIIKAATLNGNTDMYFDSEAQNEPEQLQIAPESTESDELNNLSDKSEEATERNSNDDYTIAAKDSNGGLSIIAEVHHEDIAQELQNKPTNGWEDIAKKNIKNAYDWIVGENENTLQDCEEDSDEYKVSYKFLHSGEEIIDYIYCEAITTEYSNDGYGGGKAPKEMRFAGKEFCIDYITSLLESDGYLNEPEQFQIAPESTESDELNNLSDKSEEATEQPQDASKLKQYAAWVKDRTTKELTTVVGKAESREAFYLSIKDKYRVRLITKPEKLEEECKEWEIRHARNKKMKNEKYAADKAKAKELGMSVAKYRKEVKNK